MTEHQKTPQESPREFDALPAESGRFCGQSGLGGVYEIR